MFEKIMSLFQKYHELISYVFFGVLTTIVSFGSYFILNDLVHANYLIAQIISWILAVAFAFVTNKKYVFANIESEKRTIIVQIIQFYGSRLFSFGVETLLLFLMVSTLDQNENLSKIIVSVVTVVLNYVTSKLFVFRKKSADGSDSAKERKDRKV